MDIVRQLQNQYVSLLASMYQQGHVNGQFLQLQRWQSVDEPQFLSDIVNHFIGSSDNLMHKFDIAVEQRHVDAILYEDVHQLKGSTLSIGAPRVTSVCAAFKNCYETQNYEGCLQCLQQVKEEYHLLKNKLQTMFSLQQQIIAAGGAIPIITE